MNSAIDSYMANAADNGTWIRTDKRLAIYLRDGMACMYCGSTIEDGAELTLDHVTPCEAGGDNSEHNLICACRHCNCSRRDLSLRNWLIVLRDRGVDTSKMAAKIRRNTKKDLRSFRAEAKKLIARR